MLWQEVEFVFDVWEFVQLLEKQLRKTVIEAYTCYRHRHFDPF